MTNEKKKPAMEEDAALTPPQEDLSLANRIKAEKITTNRTILYSSVLTKRCRPLSTMSAPSPILSTNTITFLMSNNTKGFSQNTMI